MRVDAAASYIRALEPTRSSTPTSALSPATGSPAAAADGGDIKQADFSSMTRQDLRNWVNEQIRSGQMSLDDSRPFMAMTMKVPVGGGGEVPAATDTEQINFVERARDGLLAARSRGDTMSVSMLETALNLMARAQGQAIGIDTHA